MAFITFGCQTDDAEGQENIDPTTVDADGDGINYTNELLAGSDPNDPCDYVDQNLYYPATSLAWRNLDCDGDGVTNGMELDPDGNETIEDNKTNPKSPCDLIVANQTLEPSQEWKLGNCDGDIVSNGGEVIDNTDVNDNCDLIVASQDIDSNNTNWFEYDCDEDGKTNIREINDGTDPFDPTDFDGAGSILKEIYRGTKLNYSEKYTFLENGTLFDKILDANDNILIDFQYDSQNRLVSFINNTYDYTVNYDYNLNNEITEITIIDEGEVYSYSLVYDDNIIYTYDGNEPPGLFTVKYTFNDQNMLILKESLASSTEVYKQIFTYDSNFNNLLYSFSELLGYDPETGESFNNGYYSEVSKYYNYNDNNDLINLFTSPFQNIKMNVLLAQNPETLLGGLFFNNLGALSSDFLSSYSVSTNSFNGGVNYSYGYSVGFIQENGLPSIIGWGTFDINPDYEVHYE